MRSDPATAPSEKYPLLANEVERQRLEHQHQWLKRDFNDGQLLPDGLHFDAGGKILDAGTGTGAWARDVALSVPAGVQVVGVDLTGGMFPTDGPPNVSFDVHSILSLPKEWSSTFSLGHSRLLVGALTLDDWKKALSELYRVLKPGGTLVLEELDVIRVMSEGMGVDPPITAKYIRALRQLIRARNIGAEYLPQMVEMLAASGFEDVQTKVRILPCGPGDIGKDIQITNAAVWKALEVPMLKGGGYGLASTDEEYDRIIDSAIAEWRSVGIDHKFLSWIAKKPERPLN